MKSLWPLSLVLKASDVKVYWSLTLKSVQMKWFLLLVVKGLSRQRHSLKLCLLYLSVELLIAFRP